MRVRVASVLAACLLLACASIAQDDVKQFEESVVRISSVKLPSGVQLRVDGGTGFCMDRACRFIGTNYHVAATVSAKKISGAKIKDRFFATGSNGMPERGVASYLGSGTDSDTDSDSNRYDIG